MSDETRLWRTVVIRANSKDARSTHLGDLFREVHRVSGVVRATACDNRDGDRADDGFPQFQLFGVGQCGGLTGGTRDNKAIVAVVLQPFGETNGLSDVERASGIEGRDHCRENLSEKGHAPIMTDKAHLHRPRFDLQTRFVDGNTER